MGISESAYFDVAAPLPVPVAGTPSIHEWRRRAVEIGATLLILLLLSPLMLTLTALMALSGKPVVFAHERVGRNGQRFRCFKFRTMRCDADVILERLLREDPRACEEWLREQKLRRDPRVTRLGLLLRKTSLDELPQLFNVLRGEMSLIGPRPVVPKELARYGRSARYYLAVRPGLSGLWQVSGRNSTTYRRRVALDRYYVRQRGAALHAWIALRTLWVVAFGIGAA